MKLQHTNEKDNLKINVSRQADDKGDRAMKAQQILVQRFLDWNKVHARLIHYNNIRKYYGEDIFHSE